MILNEIQLKVFENILSDILPVAFNLYPNGIFNALDINEQSKDKLLARLKHSGYVKNPSAAFYRNDNGDNLFQINGIANLHKLQEAAELHDTLNPKIWNPDRELLPEVKAKILEIVQFFVDELANIDVQLVVDDIHITGSNANYNYTDTSDLDIHIIADESSDCDQKHLEKIYDIYRVLFNKRYDITVNDINVEMYVENKDNINVTSSGQYSIKDGWIVSPRIQSIPKIDNIALETGISEWEARYLEISKNPQIDSIEQYIDDIYNLRKTELAKNGEFAIGNLIFKDIRRLGYLDNLKDLLIKLREKSLSL